MRITKEKIKTVNKIWSSLINLLFPNLCEVCGVSLIKSESYVCMACLYKMPLTRFWEIENNDVEKLYWGKSHIEHACALFYYRKGSEFRQLIYKLKYKGNYKVGERLGKELGKYLKNAALYSEIDVIVPVPLHPKKEKQRGYNQSEHIAAGISQIMNIPVETKTLIRVKHTETQTQKSGIERREFMGSAFAIKEKEKNNLFNKHVLLIDDVITTGSTMEACASVLINNCNCKVSIASVGFATNK